MTRARFFRELNQQPDTAAFGLSADNARNVRIGLIPGRDFTREDLARLREPVFIRTLVYSDGMIIGGMTYELDPRLETAPVERRGAQPINPHDPAITAVIENAAFNHREENETASQTADYSDDFNDLDDYENSTANESAVDLMSVQANDAAATQFLSKFGLTEYSIGKINQVKLKKVTVEIELKDE